MAWWKNTGGSTEWESVLYQHARDGLLFRLLRCIRNDRSAAGQGKQRTTWKWMQGPLSCSQSVTWELLWYPGWGLALLAKSFWLLLFFPSGHIAPFPSTILLNAFRKQVERSGSETLDVNGSWCYFHRTPKEIKVKQQPQHWVSEPKRQALDYSLSDRMPLMQFLKYKSFLVNNIGKK